MELNLLFEDEPIMPSMIVDKDLLPNKWLYTQENSAYEINGEIFFLKEDNSDEYFRFEVVSDSESLVEDEDSNAVLPISIQKTPYGLIINSVILLNSDHWNTIIRRHEYLWCSVCFNIIEESNSHVESDEHIQNMEKYPPLEKFDLNIVRLINDRLHCGVCNELFKIESENDHLNSKDHENNQLTALNRSSDVLYDFDIHSERVLKESYHFDLGNEVSSDDKNTKNVESMSVDTDVTGSYMDLNDNDVFYDVEFEYKQPISGVSYASMAANMPKEFLIDWLGTKYKIKSDSWNMIIGVKLEFYCMACKRNGEIAQKSDHCKDKSHIERLQQCQPVTQYPDYIIRKVDDKFYHCGNCNNLQLAHLISDHIERVHNQILKSIPNKTDEVLKKVKKKLSKLPKTTSSIENNVKNDEIKDTPDTSERRIVGNTGSNDHVNTGSSSNENNVTKNINNVTPKITLPDNGNLGSENHVHINSTVPFDLNKNIIIHQFGFNMRVSLLAYNLVWIQYNHFYCGLCNVLLDPAYVMPHLEISRHMQMLAQTSFLPVLGVNLMRTVYLRNSLNLNPEMLVSVHCTICNHPMVNDKWLINAHILDNVHLARLNMALDIGSQPTPLPQMVEYKHNNQIVSYPVANSGESSQINIEKNLRSETSSFDLNQEKVDNRTKVGLQQEESDKQTKVGLHQEESNKQTKVDLHQEKVVSQTKVDLHQEKVVSQTKVGLHQEKVVTQTKVDLYQEKVDSQSKVGLHKEKVDCQTKVGLHQEKVDSQTKEKVNNPSKVCLQGDKMVNQTKVGLQNEKVYNQTKGDLHQEKVESPTKVGLHQAKIDNQTKECLLQEKVDNQTDLNQDKVHNQKKVLTQNNNEIIFNLEEFIFVKLKNNFIKITLGSLNALVHIGNGGRYCFLCSLTVLALNEHLESELHLKNMNECKFIDKYEKHLIRQNPEMYHCSICNIMMSKKDIQKHLSWSLHIKSDSLKNAKRQPDSSDTKTFKISLAKEVINLKEELKGPIVLANFTFESGNTAESVAKKNKIIILNGKAFKLTWDAWQGVCKSKNGYHCNICKCDLKNYELNSHVCLGKHMRTLESFEIKYLPALIRKVDNTTLNCVTCNSEISNKYHIIIDHIKGKKHLKNYEDIRQASSNTDIGCNDDVFTIE